jgi:hypothetical protein
MARLTQLDQVLFPVEEHPILVKVPSSAGERLLAVPDKKAIVNMATHDVVGVVSRGYRLVSNREALKWGYECCRAAFPETQSSEWQVGVTDAPRTGGNCFIDLTHNSATLDFNVVSPQERPDIYGPFVRVTNSYNGLRALSFNIGFFRKICTNGLIARDAIIRFKFTHSRQDIGATIVFEVAHERLKKLKSSYKEYFDILRACVVREDESFPLVIGAFSFRAPEPDISTRESKHWADLTAYIAALCSRYSQDLGENAYSAFNAITDFASHSPSYVRRDRNSLQQLAGQWLIDFSQKCRQPNFKVSDYLASLKETATVH